MFVFMLFVVATINLVFAYYAIKQRDEAKKEALRLRVELFNTQSNLARSIHFIESGEVDNIPNVINRLAEIKEDEDALLESQRLIVGDDQGKYLTEVAELNKLGKLEDRR